VFGVPNSRSRTRISGSGDITSPYRYVHVADLTTDARKNGPKRLEEEGRPGPARSIFVDESAAQAVTLVGEVARPGPYRHRRSSTVRPALGSGRVDRQAGRTVTIEHRGGEKVELQLVIKLDEDTQKQRGRFPGDTIIVSRPESLRRGRCADPTDL